MAMEDEVNTSGAAGAAGDGGGGGDDEAGKAAAAAGERGPAEQAPLIAVAELFGQQVDSVGAAQPVADFEAMLLRSERLLGSEQLALVNRAVNGLVVQIRKIAGGHEVSVRGAHSQRCCSTQCGAGCNGAVAA